MSSNPHHTPPDYSCELRVQDLIEDKIVHDIRNPLSSIMSIAEMLGQRSLSSDEHEWVKRIASLSSQTLDLVKMASDYSKKLFELLVQK